LSSLPGENALPAGSGAGKAVAPLPRAGPGRPAAVHALPEAPPRPPAGLRPPVRRARMRRRHWLVLLSFVLLVVLPSGGAGWYLRARAADQYASYLGFSVRRDEGGLSAAGLLGGLAQITGPGASPDGEILHALLQSQQFVAGVDAALDLRALWALPGRSWARGDPVFAFDPGGSIEDLLDYWRRMVRISWDGGTGLIEVRALAFRPGDATAITREILARSEQAINELNAAARADALRHARADLEEAVERLKDAREALTRFRSRHQIVDPVIDLQAQSGLIGTLQAQLAEALIAADLLREGGAADPRLVQAERRIAVIEARIADERRRLGAGTETGEEEAFAGLVGDYERLRVEEEFARQSWLAAMTAHDAALAESARQSRWLAAHVLPTTAESARFPRRAVLAGLVALFAFLAWAILVLGAWSLRDRR